MLPNVHVHASVVQISEAAEEEAVVATGEESLMELGANKVGIRHSVSQLYDNSNSPLIGNITDPDHPIAEH